MNTLYVIEGYIAHSEVDDFEQGCIGPCETQFFQDKFSAPSLKELLELLSVEFKCPIENMELNSCEEPGRIDIQVMQSQPFAIAKVSEAKQAKWRNGETKLYLTDYSMQVVIEQHEVFLTLGN